MSDADSGVEPVTVERNDLHVRKTVEPTDDGVSQVVIRVDSDREEPAHLRLVDPVPATVPQHSVGLHPDHRDAWDVDDEGLVLDTEVPAGDTFETLYGVDSTDPTVLQAFSRAPSVTVESPDAAEGEGAAAEPFESGEAAADDGPLLRGGGDAAATEASVATDGTGTRAGAGPDVEALVAAIEAADEDEREALRDALLDGNQVGRSFDARLGSLQRKVADLTAYSEALEAFIDENGGAQQILERVEEDLQEVRSVADDAAARADDAFDAAEAAEGEVDDLSATVNEMHEDVADLGDAVDHAEGRLDDLAGEVGALRTDVATLAEELRATRRWQSRVADAAGEHGGDGLGDLRIESEGPPADDEADAPAEDGDAEAGDDTDEGPIDVDADETVEADEDPIGDIGASGSTEADDDPIGELDADDDDPIGDLGADDSSDDDADDPLSGIGDV